MDNFKSGIKNGIPIGLGYFAVAFSLGIAASNVGLNIFQGMLTSLLMIASAGESAGIIAIGEQIPYLQIVLVTLVANARYILMSFALSQKISPNEKMVHRFLLAHFITDEFFGLEVNQNPYCDPYVTYGAAAFAVPCWVIGTGLGILMGNILPEKIVIALSVALYGMFLAIIIPPAKKDKAVTIMIIISFVSSYIFSRFTNLSSSLTTIILTIVISSIGALLFTRGDDHE